MEVLGQGENHATIYTRDGRTKVLDLRATSIEWPRLLCETGRATVQIAPADCEVKLNDLATWAHTLVVHRNDDRVWEGPLRKITHAAKGLTLVASDVSGWMERRRIRTRRRSATAKVITEMQWTVNEAFDLDDPYVLTHLQTLGGVDLGATIDRDIAVASAYHSEDLSNLVGAGGRWTVVGRRIVLWPSTASIGATRDLSPENHLNADVSITEDGDDLATSFAARNDDGVVGTASGPDGDVDPFYGLVDGLGTLSGHATPAALTSYAASILGQSYPAPVTIDLPSDATLRPDAPFPIRDLVPGVHVPVQTVTATSRRIRASMILTGVKVTQQAGSPEVVSITLAPPGEAVS